MALAFVATVYDGVRCKILEFAALDNDAAANLTVAFDGLAGRPTPLAGQPAVEGVQIRTCTDFDLDFAITAATLNSITIRKLTAAGAGGAVSVWVTLRIPRGIAG